MLEYLIPVANYVVGALAVGGLTTILRWGLKVDRGLSHTVQQAELLTEKLRGHEELDDARHAAAERAIDRLNDMALASSQLRQ